MKFVFTQRRWKAMQCAEVNCKRPRVIFVRLALGEAGMCAKHWKAWTEERRSTSAPPEKP